MFQKLYNGILNFVLPNSCISCQKAIGAGDKYLCSECFSVLEHYNDNHPWQAEKIADGTIDNSLSAFWFREGAPIQTLFHSLKYQKMKSVGIILGEELGRIIQAKSRESFNMIIPVPLHKAKLRDRTYNQSEFIAKGISNILNAQVINDAVIRTRFTGTQTKLNKSDRKDNVRGAFEVNPKHKSTIKGKNIILVDDVITTGATILECALALKRSGCGKLWVCSAAYAELKLNVV